MGAAYRSQSLRIRQPRVEQDDIDRMLAKVLLGRTHAIHVLQFGVMRAVIAKHFSEQSDVSGIIFDQENCFDQFRARLLSACAGN